MREKYDFCLHIEYCFYLLLMRIGPVFLMGFCINVITVRLHRKFHIKDKDVFLKDQELLKKDNRLLKKDKGVLKKDQELFKKDNRLFLKEQELFLKCLVLFYRCRESVSYHFVEVSSFMRISYEEKA